jgi:N-acetylglucosamine malate deacetylase 1
MKKNAVLVVAAHPDDEVLGCGGTIARFAKEGRDVHILILADGEGSRAAVGSLISKECIESRAKAAKQAGSVMGCASVILNHLPDNRLDSIDMLDIVKIIEKRIGQIGPRTVLTHHCGDVNVDHCITHEAVLAASRPQPGHPVKELFFFEVPSSTEWRPPNSPNYFNPGLFVDIDNTLKVKKEALKVYKDELRLFPHPRSLESVEALARWRGATAGVLAAEAFEIGRQII